MTTTTARTDETTRFSTPWRGRVALVLLGAMIFVTISYEMLPIGLLGAIARDLGTTSQATGLLVSAYAAVVVLAAIPLSAALAKFDARRTLMVLLLVFVASAGTMALSTSMAVAVVARLVGGVAHAVLFTSVYRVALSLVPADRLGLAAGTVSAGNALALSLGVPVTTALGFATSWHTPFVVIAALFAVLTLLAVLVIPVAGGAGEPGMSTREALREARRWPLLRVGVTVTGFMLAHFATYTYIEPFLREAGVSDGRVGAVLMGYGVASILGLVAASRFSDRQPAAALKVAAGLATLALAGLFFARDDANAASIAVVTWGLTFGALPVLLHVLALRSSPRSPESAPAVVNSTFNIGIALGSVLGGQVLAVSDASSTTILSAGLFIIMIAAICVPRWLPCDTVR